MGSNSKSGVIVGYQKEILDAKGYSVVELITKGGDGFSCTRDLQAESWQVPAGVALGRQGLD